MAKKSEPHDLSIARCKRIVRPLLSKVHSLTDTHSKHPAKLVFDTDLLQNGSGPGSGEYAKFRDPASAHDRLSLLKPYLASETYEAYTEIFTIFRNIVHTLYPPDAAHQSNSRGKPGRVAKKQKQQNGQMKRVKAPPKLTSLAAQKLGKSIALGTKSTHYTLNQTALFDPDSIPLYLRKYREQLAEDIDAWLSMEPASILSQHRPELLLGYVFHIIVFNSRSLFYTLVPVLCHWLHEQGFSSSRFLFMEYWSFSPTDPDHQDVSDLTNQETTHDWTLSAFWFFHKTGYWQSLIRLLGVKSSESNSNRNGFYDALLIEAVVYCDRVNLDVVDVHELYAVMRTQRQHPKNTQLCVSIVAYFITDIKKAFGAATTSSATLAYAEKSYRYLHDFIKAWLCLHEDALFNSVDKGLGDLFDACLSILARLQEKCSAVVEYLGRAGKSAKVGEVRHKFHDLQQNLLRLEATCKLLQAFYLDTSLPASVGESLESPEAIKYFKAFVNEHHDKETLGVFVSWLSTVEEAGAAGGVAVLRRQMSSIRKGS